MIDLMEVFPEPERPINNTFRFCDDIVWIFGGFLFCKPNKNMKIDFAQFQKECKEIAQRDEWRMEGFVWNEKFDFLERRNHFRFSESANDETQSVLDDSFDPASLPIKNQSSFLVEYHILYSSVFQVPVLYFSIINSVNSQPITSITHLSSFFSLIPFVKERECQEKYSQIDNSDEPDEITPTPNVQSDSVLEKDLLMSISQGEHPFLGDVFFFLHPCRTPDWFGVGVDSQNNLVLSWLSVVLNSIGYKLDMSFYK